MSLSDDCRDLLAPWLAHPRLRAAVEIRALWRTCTTAPDNNDARKYATAILVLTWSVLTVLIALQRVPDPSAVFYGPFTAFVWILVGRMWGVEVERVLGGLDVSVEDTDDDE